MMAPSPQPLSRGGERGLFGEQAVQLAGLAARVLGWRPGEFWAATPAELAAVFADEAVEPVAGEELAALMRRFPDGVNHG
jgi:uncharacterized phage protein (TIGR02216 family)